jgi:hypothetical protein
VLAGGGVALVLSSSGKSDTDAGTGSRVTSGYDAGVEFVDEPPGDRVCQPLPSFGEDRQRLKRFTRAVRQLTQKQEVAVAWLIDADTAADKDELTRTLDAAGFTVQAGRFEGGSWSVTATRRTSLDLSALTREQDALLRASPARSDRTILMVAYPAAGCKDTGPGG